MGNRSKPALLIVLLFLFSSLAAVITSVSANPVVDNYPEGEAWITIELKSWEADQTEQWDSDDGNPDPHFEVCIEADGNNVQCENSQTWSNQLTLGNVWNFSIDIPDETSIVNLTIECRDNDALSDDECDMNPVTGEWKLYYEFNWTNFTSLDFSGDGSLDNDSVQKDAASNWTVTSWGIIDDDDSDNVANIHDSCPNGFGNWTYDNITDYDSDGCLDGDWYGLYDIVSANDGTRIDTVVSDDEGRVYVAGMYWRSLTLGNFTLTPSDGYEATFVARLGLDGAWDWAVDMDNTSVNVQTQLDIDANGNAYFSGRFDPRITGGQPADCNCEVEWGGTGYTNGDPDTYHFVAKVNSDGTEDYLRRFIGNSIIDSLSAVNGQVYFTTLSPLEEMAVGFSQDCTSSSSRTIHIIRLSSGTVGSCNWRSASYTASSSVTGVKLAVSNNGEIFIGGRFSGELSFGSHTLYSSSGSPFFLAKGGFSSAWAWATGDANMNSQTPTDSLVDSIYVTSSGDPILTGKVDTTSSFSGITTTSYGGQDLFVAKFFSNNGTVDWVTTAGSSGTESADDIYIDSEGVVNVVGRIGKEGSPTNANTVSFGHHSIDNRFSQGYIARYNSTLGAWTSVSAVGNNGSGNYHTETIFVSKGPGNGSLAIGGMQNGWTELGLFQPALTNISNAYHGFIALYNVSEDSDDDNDGIADELDSCYRGDLNWTSNLTTDWDADGCQDSGEDTDDDADNVTDSSDLCPQTILLAIVDSVGCSYAQRDNDGDGLQNSLDDCENGTQGWTADGLSDYDSDGCADADEDLDDDNDGVLDEQDLCELGTLDWQSDSSTDYDSDGCQDSGEDDDDDNDNLTDSQDNCNTGDLNWNSSGITDYDSDGCQDSGEDNDDDNDLVLDNSDNCTNGDLDWVSDLVTDHDSDGCQDSLEDNDDDNDLVLDSFDDCTPGELGWISELWRGSDYDSDGCQDISEDTDDDNDGIIDSNDFCQFGDLGWISGVATDSDGDGCQDDGEDTDDDNDLVDDALDECQNTPIDETSNGEGCSNSQRDSDQDGVNDAEDQCPQSGEIVDSQGCDLDTDSDGVIDMWDDCANTPNGYPVDVSGCPLDTDSDSDGVYDGIDECENTPLAATVDSKGCPMDSDSDGVYDGIDECPSSNNPAPSDMDKSSEVDSTGCFIDAAEGESDSSSAAFGFLAIVVMIGLLVLVVRKIRSSNEEQVSYAQTELPSAPILPILPIQQVQMPDVVRELEKQRSQAQIESQQLRQQLSSQSISASQMAAMQQELENLQQRVSDSEYVKSQLVQEIDDMKKKGDSELSMQDSVIAGDALVGSTKIESQTINNDPQAIARAAIEAYRMAKEEQLD